MLEGRAGRRAELHISVKRCRYLYAEVERNKQRNQAAERRSDVLRLRKSKEDLRKACMFRYELPVGPRLADYSCT